MLLRALFRHIVSPESTSSVCILSFIVANKWWTIDIWQIACNTNAYGRTGRVKTENQFFIAKISLRNYTSDFEIASVFNVSASGRFIRFVNRPQNHVEIVTNRNLIFCPQRWWIARARQLVVSRWYALLLVILLLYSNSRSNQSYRVTSYRKLWKFEGKGCNYENLWYILQISKVYDCEENLDFDAHCVAETTGRMTLFGSCSISQNI